MDFPIFHSPSAFEQFERPLPRSGLWVSGALDGLFAPVVAVVGSRTPSDAGRRLAKTIAGALAQAGTCVVSGLASGIDAAAHLGALEAGGPTIGILGGGHRRFFPLCNRALAERMIERGGAVLSPFAPDEPALPGRFLQRNAYVAGLADLVLVVEASFRSGALNTAGHAASAGITVLACPGDVDRPKVAGCLALLRDGATLCRDARDVLEALPRPTAARLPLRISSEEPGDSPIQCVLREGEASHDHLQQRLRWEPGQLAAALVELELSGAIESRAGGLYGLV